MSRPRRVAALRERLGTCGDAASSVRTPGPGTMIAAGARAPTVVKADEAVQASLIGPDRFLGQRQNTQTRNLVKNHGTPSSDVTPRTEGTRASRKQLPEWVLLLPVVAVSSGIFGGWVAALTSSALFVIAYFARTKYRARRSRANN